MVWQALGAVGSLLAVVVAVGIAVVDYKTHGAALNREREHREARESVESARLHREQAERVSAYVEVPVPPNVGWTARTDGVPTLHNGSDRPIYLVRVDYRTVRGRLDGERDEEDIAVLPAGSLWTGKRLVVRPFAGRAVAAVVFRDAANVWWGRDRDGVLSELESPPRPEIGEALHYPPLPGEAAPSSEVLRKLGYE